jgi:hypothetical protein
MFTEDTDHYGRIDLPVCPDEAARTFCSNLILDVAKIRRKCSADRSTFAERKAPAVDDSVADRPISVTFRPPLRAGPTPHTPSEFRSKYDAQRQPVIQRNYHGEREDWHERQWDVAKPRGSSSVSSPDRANGVP